MNEISQNNYVIQTSNLTKVYGSKTVLDHVNMHVAKGDIYGFIGKNGAGKTTLMKLLLGMSQATDGKITLFGTEKLNLARTRIGSIIEEPALYQSCSAFENMQRFAILAGSDSTEIEGILRFVGLGNVGKKKVGKFSLGMKQRLGIAIAMLGQPELLILDEPINGLDPEGIKEIRDLLLRMNRELGVTILVSSHLLDELAKITTRYGIINQGRLVEEITATALLQECQQRLHIVTQQPAVAANLIKQMASNVKITANENSLDVMGEDLDSAKVNQALVKGGVEVETITFITGNLEDYFIERMGGKA